MLKHCKRCGVVIADTDQGDYYHNIRVQYCDACRLASKRESKAAYMRELRKKTKEQHKITQEMCKELRESNDLLRAELIRLREENRRLSGG